MQEWIDKIKISIKNIYIYLTKVINQINKVIEYVNTIMNKIIGNNIHIYILIFWAILLMGGYITENRLIRFCIILLIISIYKIIHKKIDIINKYIKKINIKQETLLKIYRYKNPLIILLIKSELELSNIMYNTTKNDIKYVYKKIIYNILYHFTGYNGIKIILCKFYVILNDWKKYTIYEIIFKRMYGTILSVLIFTNIIQLILIILKTISTSIFVWIYLILIIISYIMELPTIRNIEYLRKESNLIWLILIKEKEMIINPKNQEIQTLIGILFLKEIKYMLNYENYLNYLMLSSDDKFNYYKPSYIYCYEIQNIFFDTDYIFINNTKLKKLQKTQNDINIINYCEYCEYNKLLYKIILFYIWDLEKVLEMQETLLKIEKDNIDFTDLSLFTYDYNIKKFREIYYEKIDNVKLDKFWDLKENYEFYEKMHNYLYNNMFENTHEYKKLLKLINDYDLYDKYVEEIENTNDNQRYQELEQQLKDWREKWEIEIQQEDNNREKKYYNIFKKIDIITNKYII